MSVVQIVRRDGCAKATFLLSTLTASILASHYSYAMAPEVDTKINNTASATYNNFDHNPQSTSSNTVDINIAALYAVNLTSAPLQTVEIGKQVLWSNELTNSSNAPVHIKIHPSEINGLNNVKVYLDTNQNGEFDNNDQIVDQAILLHPRQKLGI